MTIASNIEAIQAKIARAGQNSPLSVLRPTLLGASKGQNEAAIEEAIIGGLRVFGENRVQEAQAKWSSLRARHQDIELHLIGPLQTNKVKEALELFDVIQTLDRKKLAETIASELKKMPHRAAVKFFIQINTGKEPQKAGVVPEEADAFIDDCINTLHLPVVGLMCVPPVGQVPSPHFALLRKIAQAHGLKKLSMGMSEDFETAIRMGSTCVRLGTAIFGERI
jgi:pyridoxal phosphate enzyme (YggS family)